MALRAIDAYETSVSTAVLGMRNFKQSNTSIFRKVIGDGISGLARGRIACLGTSVVRGTGSNTPATFQWSWPSLLRLILTGSKNTAFFGDGGAGSFANLKVNDPRITSSGTVENTVNLTMGGYLLSMAQNATVTFTPGGTFDTVDVFTARSSGNGTYTVSIDGGVTPLDTVSTSGDTGVLLTTSTVTAGSTAVTIKNITAATVYLIGLNTRTAASPGIELLNAGFGGSVIAQHIPTGLWYERSVMTVLMDSNASNSIVAEPCVINDSAAGTPLATYTADVNTWLTALKALGDVIVTIPPMVNPATNPTFGTYADAAVGVGLSLDLPILDMRALFPTYSSSNMADNVHPNGVTYAQWAKQLSNSISN